MLRKERLFKLLKQKEKLITQKQAQAVKNLSDEFGQTEALTNRLETLQKTNLPPDRPVLPHELRSMSWYGRYMAEQLELAQNRLDFLSNELTTAQSHLARHQVRTAILEDRAQAAARDHADHKDAVAEAQIPPRCPSPK